MNNRLSMYWGGIVSSSLMLSGIWPLNFASAQQGQQGTVPPALVEVAPVLARKITPISWMPGTVLSRNDSRIASELDGRLEQVAQVGDYLEPGDVVAQIAATSFRLRVKQAQAELEELRPDLKFYSKEAMRLARLAQEDNAAQNRLDEITAQRDALARRLDSAEVRLHMAEDELSKVWLRTPFAGVVAERLSQPGEQVQLGDPVLRIVDTRNLEVQARIAAGGITSLRIGDTLRLRDQESTEHSGRIHALVPVGDESRLYEIRIALEDVQWPVGWPLQVAVPGARARDALLVPRDALVLRSFGISVFVVDARQQARMVQVQTGYAEQDWIEVRGDLQAGESVVVRGNERLIPGQSVQLKESGSSE